LSALFKAKPRRPSLSPSFEEVLTSKANPKEGFSPGWLGPGRRLDDNRGTKRKFLWASTEAELLSDKTLRLMSWLSSDAADLPALRAFAQFQARVR
jgi:hypothetical protein